MGSAEEVILLGAWFSPYACRVQWALKLKGIKYQVIEEDVYNKSSFLLKLNPVYKKIPVLVHNGKPIVDSICIIEYIDDTWKQNPIMPQDPYERAMARFWANFIEEKLHKAVRRAKVFKAQKNKQETEVNQAKEALQLLEQELNGKKFFGGDSIGFVDVVLGWIILWLGAFEEIASIKVFDSEEYPLLDEWIQNFASSEEVKGTLPPKDKLLQFVQGYGQYPRAQVSIN